MFESKYSKVLTIILVIVIILIIGLLGFLAYDYYQKVTVTNDAASSVDEFNGEVSSGDDENTVVDGDTNTTVELSDGNVSGNSGSTKKKMYKGFEMIGTLEIPKTNVKYPILKDLTKKSLETSVVYLYGNGVNQVGNSVIIGHNYRNGLFFSNNDKLSNGDKIYVTDLSGKRVTYTIYNKFNATPNDTSFYQRNTNGKPEITLSTCNDDSSARIIIEARVD